MSAELSDATALAGDPDALRGRLASEGYLWLRGLLPAGEVTEVRAAITTALDAAGWLADGSDPAEARPGPGFRHERAQVDDAYLAGYELLQRVQRFHELAHHPALVGLAAGILDAPVLAHPRKIVRASPPDDDAFRTPAHQDYRLIQGTVDVLTAWIPLGDCPDELGGLRILAGSPAQGLRPVAAASAVGGVAIDERDEDPDRWRHAPMAAGDVLMFHSLTVHAARPNRTDRLRLSVDYRYQSQHEPIVAGSLRPHWWPRVADHDELTRGWTSTAAVDAPAGLRVAPPLPDPLDPDLVPPPSRLVPDRPQ